jgi:CheY-like chemotaxis protein
MLRRLIGEDVRLELDLAPHLWPVRSDPGQLTQVLINLTVNARDAMAGAGTLRVRTENVQVSPEAASMQAGLSPGSYAALIVEDTGGGIDPAVLPHIFEPFFTTKDVGHGTGLGLATVYGIVKQSDGYVSVESTPGQGARFSVLLPRTIDADAATLVRDPEPPVRGSETVLLVEDDRAVRAAVRRMLDTLGYVVLEASTGVEALGMVRHACERGRAIDVVLTDVVMPELGGRALSDAIAEVWPGMTILYMSGYTDDEIVRRGAMVPGSLFLEKPFTTQDLAAAMARALATRRRDARPSDSRPGSPPE